jgi:AraC-like DNA-binding protein
MDYQVYQPGEELSAFVKCYWTLESPVEKSPQRQTIVADGCLEMIFHYGDLYKQYLENGKSILQPRCFVIGQLTRPLEIEPTGETGIFSVRFHPEGFNPLAGIALKELENTAVDLEKLFGKEGKEIRELVLNAGTTAERIGLVERFLIARLTDAITVDRIVRSAVETILTAGGQTPVHELSKQINTNLKQLERKFSSHIGLSPKQLSRIIRLQSTLKMLLSGQFTSLSALAYEGEYYDQAHFIKDFKDFTGSTPKEFFCENLKMTSLFIKD